jgi:hypothetical protein
LPEPVQNIPLNRPGQPGREQLERLEVLDQIPLLLRVQVEFQHSPVVVHNRVQVREAAVVIKAAFRTRKQPAQRGGPVFVVGRTAGLEIVDPNIE